MNVQKPEYDTTCDCKPQYFISKYGLLRFAELLVGVVVCGCVSTTCNKYACINLTTQFGVSAVGQAYVLMGAGIAIILTASIVVSYALNLHRVAPGAITAVEKACTVFIIANYVAIGVIECYYSAVSGPGSDLADLGRTNMGIQPQWIAACIFAFVNLALYIVDFVGQLSANYPTQYTRV